MLCHQGLTLRRVGVNVSKFSTSLHKPFLKESFVFFFLFVVVQSLSVSTSSGPHGLQHARPPVFHYLLEFAQTRFHWVSYATQPFHPLYALLLLSSIFPSIRVLSSESALWIRWPKYWSFSFSISPSSEYSRFIFFMIDWYDILAVQGVLKSLLQHHSSKSSIFQHSAFFMIQLSHLHMSTGKTIALTIQTFVGKVMSMLLDMLFRFVIAFLPRSKRLFISWLQSLSTVILEPRKIKSSTVSIVSSSICH